MIRDILFTPYYIYRGHAESVETTGASARAVLHQEPSPMAPAATVCATLFDAHAPIATPIITLGDKNIPKHLAVKRKSSNFALRNVFGQFINK